MLNEIHINAHIGHKTWGAGRLIGWNPTGVFEGTGCAVFTGAPSNQFHTVTGKEYKEGLWWLILGDSNVPVDAPRPTVEV